MFIGGVIITILLAGFVVLLRQAGTTRHPLLQILREKGIRPGRTELLLCRRPSFVSACQLMTEREQRFLHRLDRVTDTRQWQLCPQPRGMGKSAASEAEPEAAGDGRADSEGLAVCARTVPQLPVRT